MFENAENFADVFRGSLPYYLLITLPLLIICFSNPVLSSSEFAVHKMSQFDVNGVSYGCRSSALNLEAKSLYSWSTSRHCVLTRFQDMTIDQFREIRAKAGGLVVLLPKDIPSLSQEEKQHLYLLEQDMMAQESFIPVYFSPYNIELEKIIEDISRNTNDVKNSNHSRGSALNELITTASANGYQIFVSGASQNANKQSKIPIIQGELAPNQNKISGENEAANLPVIIIVTHLDTFGLYNEYLSNTDAAVMFSIAELFSKIYSSMNLAPKYRIIFLLSESGVLINFQGIKKWLDENTQIQNVDFVLCLDTLIQATAEPIDSFYMHVSKPPKDNTPISNFYKKLQFVATNNNITVEGVHKKINLAEVFLGWEHERFSMKRFPAFTLSSLKSHKNPIRTTIFKDDENKILENSRKNTKILAEALARYVYNIEDEGEIFSNAIDVTDSLIKSWMQVKSALHNNDIKNSFEKYLKNVKITFEKPDLREQDFMFYENQDATLFVYRVKPAVFDLFLTVVIAVYLACFYLAIIYFPHLYTIICKISKLSKSKLKSS